MPLGFGEPPLVSGGAHRLGDELHEGIVARMAPG
jgi:hypothetical protein